MAITKTFSERFKEARNATGLSVPKLAERMLISKRTLEKWESGERVPPPYVQRFVLNELEELKRTTIIIDNKEMAKLAHTMIKKED